MEIMNKRIAFIVNTMSNGGAERTISNITLHLPNEYKADIIVNDDQMVTYPVNASIISLGLKPQDNKLDFFYQLNAFIRRLVTIKRLKKQNGYKVVISFSESASIANILSGNKYAKTMLSVRIHLSSSKNKMLYRIFGFPMVKLLYNRADRIVAVSKGVENDLIDNFGIKKNKITTIPNGCDIKMIQMKGKEQLSDEEKLLISGHEHVIVTMGRLEYQKGQWHLIRALSTLKKEGLDFKLLILGKGSLQSYLKSLVEQYGLSDNVIFPGFMSNPFKIISNADLYVLPSLYEGMGNSLIEAMACGIPCISTDHKSGAREILAPDTDVRKILKDAPEYARNGILVPVPDGQMYSADEPITREEVILSEAIKEMLTNDSLKQKYALLSSARASEMNLEDAVNRWLTEIESME